MRYDLVVVGHIVRDSISRRGRKKVLGSTLGGPCIYSGLAACALRASVLTVSRVGRDFRKRDFDWIAKRGISTDHIQVSNSPTTCIRIAYHKTGRTMRITHRCESLTYSDLANIPSTLALHIGPVFHEVPESLALRLAQRECVVSLEAQGYTRRLGRDGRVNPRKWNNRHLLRNVGVMKASENELRAITGDTASARRLAKVGPAIILLTKGTMGTVVWSRNEGVYKVPAYQTHVVDPTGAGDALIGGFLVAWVRTGELLWSCAVGSAIASFVVESPGPSNFGSSKEIEGRAQEILNGATRMRGRI